MLPFCIQIIFVRNHPAIIVGSRPWSDRVFFDIWNKTIAMTRSHMHVKYSKQACNTFRSRVSPRRAWLTYSSSSLAWCSSKQANLAVILKRQCDRRLYYPIKMCSLRSEIFQYKASVIALLLKLEWWYSWTACASVGSAINNKLSLLDATCNIQSTLINSQLSYNSCSRLTGAWELRKL